MTLVKKDMGQNLKSFYLVSAPEETFQSVFRVRRLRPRKIFRLSARGWRRRGAMSTWWAPTWQCPFGGGVAAGSSGQAASLPLKRLHATKWAELETNLPVAKWRRLGAHCCSDSLQQISRKKF